MAVEEQPERTSPPAGGDVARAREELARRFSGSGCVARLPNLAAMLPGVDPRCVEEALHLLCEEGVAEMDCLADGSLICHFSRR